jgi:Transposase DDE domain
MYPELYQKWFRLSLSPTEMVLIEILMKVVGLLSKATLGQIANSLPLPILADSRRKTMQRFLDSQDFCKEKIWWGIWMELMTGYWLVKEPIILAIDRTSWGKYNLLVVSWIIYGRAIPINWQLLDKLGSSNLDEQQSVIYPIMRLLPEHSFRLLGDREFCSKDLANWLLEIGWGYCLRIKKSTYVHLTKEESLTLNQLASHPGISVFLQGVNITKSVHKFPFNIVAHYPKEHHGFPITEGWFLLTTLPDINAAVTAYATRFQIEEMFRDYKSYGFNLELTQLTGSRFDAWFLLLTLVYSTVVFTSICIPNSQHKYLARTTESQRQYPRTSMFSLGKFAVLSNFDWHFIPGLISRYIRLNRHKIDCYTHNLNIYNLYSVRV